MDTTKRLEPPEQQLGVLRQKLGSQAVLIGTDVPPRNCSDWSGSPPQAPVAVVRPRDTAGVSEAVVACRRAGLSFVPQGGLTGHSGGAVPEPGWVAISLECMVGIEEIDHASATMIVKAGTPLEAVQKAASEAALFFPLDLGSRSSCAIGGNVSTNAGGNRVIRYGMTRELVLGLEVVLPDGTIISNLNKLAKNNAGYDLKHLFIGSEGTLGIVTRVVLRLFPKPQSTMAALCGVADYAAILTLLNSARNELGPLLSAFEVMWPDYWEVVTTRAGVRPPLRGRHGLYVLVEAHGTEERIDAPRFEDWLKGLMERGLLTDTTVAQSLAQTQAFWVLRECAELGQVIGPRVNYDIGLAVARMDEFVGLCKASLTAGIPGCDSAHFGHIGDGNLHVVAWAKGLPVQPKAAMDAIVYGLVRDMGGSISAEHGIGTLKKQWLGYTRNEAEIALMRTLKTALDPDHLLNPGKVI